MKITLDGVTKSIEMPTVDEILEKLSDKKLDGSQNQYFKELKEKIKNGEEINNPENRQIRDNAFLAAEHEVAARLKASRVDPTAARTGSGSCGTAWR